jgi:hypothetical protein
MRYQEPALRFLSAREACLHLLRSSRAPSGHFLPITATELAPLINREGFYVSERDVEALLRDLADSGEATEIDPQAGYRWVPNAA